MPGTKIQPALHPPVKSQVRHHPVLQFFPADSQPGCRLGKGPDRRIFNLAEFAFRRQLVHGEKGLFAAVENQRIDGFRRNGPSGMFRPVQNLAGQNGYHRLSPVNGYGVEHPSLLRFRACLQPSCINGLHAGRQLFRYQWLCQFCPVRIATQNIHFPVNCQ